MIAVRTYWYCRYFRPVAMGAAWSYYKRFLDKETE